jgi:uncharacterized RDD family membrane protein YckC
MPTLIDTVSAVETPEGIALGLRAAGCMPRALAWLIDGAIRMAILMACATFFGVLGEAGQGIYLIALFIIFWFYPVLFEVLNNGRTPGKAALRLRVVRANGTPIGWLSSFQRNLLRTVDMLPFFYGFGLIACLVDKNSRRIGDWIADTLVVYVDVIQPPRVIAQSANVLLPKALSVHEQTALVSFAERAPTLTTERQIEIADQLVALTGMHGARGVQQVLGMAGTVLGRTTL